MRFVLVMLLMPPFEVRAQADFCHDARTDEERAVCGDGDLQTLDIRLEREHDRPMRSADTREVQRVVRKLRGGVLHRRDDCGTDIDCRAEAYREALASYARIRTKGAARRNVPGQF